MNEFESWRVEAIANCRLPIAEARLNARVAVPAIGRRSKSGRMPDLTGWKPVPPASDAKLSEWARIFKPTMIGANMNTDKKRGWMIENGGWTKQSGRRKTEKQEHSTAEARPANDIQRAPNIEGPRFCKSSGQLQMDTDKKTGERKRSTRPKASGLN